MYKLELTRQQLEAFGDKPRQYLGASEIGMCPRKTQYLMLYRRAYWDHEQHTLRDKVRAGESVQGIPIPETLPSAADQAKMKRGNLLEPLVVDLLKARGFKLNWTGDAQQEVQAGNICGHPDGVISETPDDWPEDWDGWLLEVKTTATYTLFGSKYHGGVLGNKHHPAKGPQEYYKDQVTVYAQAWDCPGVVFAYMDVVKGGIYLVPYKPERGRLQALMRKAAMILNFGKLPPMKPVGEWECQSCPFRERCRSDG